MKRKGRYMAAAILVVLSVFFSAICFSSAKYMCRVEIPIPGLSVRLSVDK